ncbi:ABC transporter ATP-binding protein [Bosea sp. BH3]|uniref:ABC transporter ATP-binding protein n=1 Tax=Bosea sp. BH3 TaxID=2871701 RepID=UPI0021CB1B8D|nr:ABC transporter ATP-binding protein [Bosea sp. BH3]MCU4181554.1 ABC transporter ATP-binding protein [Bosea sp. BH3]
MSEPLIVFDKVTKSYDGATQVVKSLDFAVERGEFVTLLGPSGSGKTTTLMMLAGFEDPSGGTITFDGRPLNNVPAHRRGIGVVFQNYALFPHMSVAANLSFPLEMQGVGRAEREERVRGALDMVKLDHLGDRRPAQLSGGQQQRVALARALVFRPKLVLMDEPLGALDKQLREHMQIEIKHIHEKLGVTVVYVTHDQGEALTMSDRVAVFHHGRIQQLAPPAEIYEKPANAFVASFIGENNRLDGVVAARDGASCLLRLADGGEVRAQIGEDLPVGAQAVLALRPEKVLIGSEAQGENRFEAEIEELIYFGDHTRLRLSFGGSDDFSARLTFKDGLGPLKKGDRIPVAWSAANCLALKPEES